MDELMLDGRKFRGAAIPVLQAKLLVIQGENSVLGCGYLNVATADKLGQALAVVTGVATYEEMFDAVVRSVSKAAAARGAAPGMTGREALLAMEKNA